MQFPESWLREFCDPSITTEELADQLTMAGLEVEEQGPLAALRLALELDAHHPALLEGDGDVAAGGDQRATRHQHFQGRTTSRRSAKQMQLLLVHRHNGPPQ